MKKLLWLLLLVAVLAGCSSDKGAANAKDAAAETEEKPAIAIEDIDLDEVIVTVNDEEITGDDLRYEMKRLELMELMAGNEPGKAEISPNVAIQELIHTKVIHHIASEENIAISTEEQEARAEAVRKEVEAVEGYEKVMKDIDAEEFWSRETDRYAIILEAEQLIGKLMEKLQEQHPDYDEQALKFEAREDLDEWVQEKIVDMDVEVKEISE